MLDEIKIEIGGETRAMRPTIEALMAIETALDTSIIKLVMKLNQKDVSINTMVAVLYYGLKAGSGELSQQKILDEIARKGVFHYLKEVTDFLALASRAQDEPTALQNELPTS